MSWNAVNTANCWNAIPATSSWNELPGKSICETPPPRRHSVFRKYFEEFLADLSWAAEDSEFAMEAPISMNARGGPSKRCTRGPQLGGGGFGRVFKVLRENDGAVLAGKTCKDVSKLVEEAEALKKHAHPHILKYEGMYEDHEFPADNMLLTELCADGSLQCLIDNHQYGLNPKAVLRVVAQVSGALEHLHAQGYFHSDVKPHNIFIRSQHPMDVVLGDCADIHPVNYGGRLLGTMQFHSPEIWSRKGHQGAPDDVWALGVSLLAMCGQQPRVEGEVRGRVKTPSLAKFPAQCIKHVETLQGLNWGHGIVQLAARMLTYQAKDRASAREVHGLATKLLEEYEAKGEAGNRLNITSPEGFEPPSFW